MKHGFTIVELIFVIVIIGILASVSIPKLAGTRDDASKSTLITNTKICINDLIAGYKGQGNTLTINSVNSCAEALRHGASITYSGDFVQVSNVDSFLNGNHPLKGLRVAY